MDNTIYQIIIAVYSYCTDFIINLANITGLSYIETNALFFCILWPVLSFAFPIIILIQRRKIRKLKQIHL